MTNRSACVTRKGRRHLGLAHCGLIVILAMGTWPQLAQAASPSSHQAAPVSFDIPPQPLTSALNSFAETSGVQVSYPSHLTAGATTAGVSGTYTPDAALRTLLVGTGVTYQYTNAATITLVQATPEAVPLESQEQPIQMPDPQAESPPQDTASKPVKVPEVVVKDVRERSDSYTADDANTATRIQVPIHDTPRSVEVITRQVLDDQKVIRLENAVRNVSGVFNGGAGNGQRSENFTIRGFNSSLNTFKNGFRDDSEFGNRTMRDTANIERVEVVKGPPSYLFGRSDPGGIVNQITKNPLKNSYYSGEMIFGNYSLYRPTIDIGGPLNDSKSLTYRFNGIYETANSYREGVHTERIFLAPTLGWEIGSRTTLRIEGEYLKDKAPIDRGIVALGNGPAPISIRSFLGDPNRIDQIEQGKATLILLHDFNDQWRYRSGFRAAVNSEKYDSLESWVLDPGTGNLTLSRFQLPQQTQSFYWQNEIHGKFHTGSLFHRLLVGVELGREVHTARDQKSDFAGFGSFINIFNTNDRLFVNTAMDDSNIFNSSKNTNGIIGIYAGDQIDLLENLHLHAGGRFDIFEQKLQNYAVPGVLDASQDEQTNTAFSPSIGLTYQPWKPIAIYANYTKSFAPQTAGARAENGTLFDPERGQQYEAGVKFQAFEGRLRSSVAVFNIKKKNVLTPDLSNRLFSIATGEQRSRGVEFDVAGQILPGWDVIANYAYIDATITNDNTFQVGSRLPNVPLNQGSVWTTYFFQEGIVKGFGAGVGMYAQSKRNGVFQCADPANCVGVEPFDLPGFVRMDAALYYRKPEIFNRTNLLAAINFTNLLDQRYFTGAGGFREIVMPGAPLTVLGSIKLEFN